MENCIFCKIINKEKEGLIISENEHVIVLNSMENHPLVIPKKHIKDIYSLDEETGKEIMKEVVRTANAVKKGLNCEGVYLTQANEPAAGQEVFHIHFHLYPRWTGQPMNQMEKVEIEEREKTLQKIKAAL